MQEYEVLIETMTACGGEKYANTEFVDVETDSPRRYVEENGRFPILDELKNAQGDTVILTGDAAGNRIRYTFS